jgi:hypothetical protein
VLAIRILLLGFRLLLLVATFPARGRAGPPMASGGWRSAPKGGAGCSGPCNGEQSGPRRRFKFDYRILGEDSVRYGFFFLQKNHLFPVRRFFRYGWSTCLLISENCFAIFYVCGGANITSFLPTSVVSVQKSLDFPVRPNNTRDWGKSPHGSRGSRVQPKIPSRAKFPWFILL